MTGELDIVAAFREGKLSLAELKGALLELRDRVRYELSESQRGLWLIQKNYPLSAAYNVPIGFRAKHLDVAAFRRAVDFIAEQYPYLRSRIRRTESEPYRQIDRQVADVIHVMDSSGGDHQDVPQLLKAKVKEPFDLERDGILKIHICNAAADTFVLILFHHIAMDGIAAAVLLEKLYGAYKHYRAGNRPPLDRSIVSFDSYVREEKQLLSSEEGRQRLAYWRAELEGVPPVAGLASRAREADGALAAGTTNTMVLSSVTARRLREHVKGQKVSLSTFLLGVFNILLRKYTSDDDLVVALPVNARPGSKYDTAAGHFVHLLMIRSVVDDRMSVAEYLGALQKKVIEGMRQAYPYPRLVKELGLATREGAYPIVHATFAHHDFLSQLDIDATEWEVIDSLQQEGEFELFLETVAKSDSIELRWKYDPGKFDGEAVARMQERYVYLLEQALDAPALSLADFSLLTPREEQILLLEWNYTRDDFQTGRCLHEIFDAQARANPGRIAVQCAEGAHSFSELRERTDEVAAELRKAPDQLVAVLVDRSVEMLVAILGILKSGAAYVPLDPEQPTDRLSAILADAGASAIVTQSKYKEKACALLGRVPRCREIDDERLTLVDLGLDQQSCRIAAPQTSGSARAAYVLYTSGTTGRPKGIRVTHKSILNTLCFLEKEFPVGEGDTWLLKTNYTFDVSISELFGWFMGSGRLAILPVGQEREPEQIIALMERQKVTHVNFVPSMLTAFLTVAERKTRFLEICPLKYLLVAGEAFPPALAAGAVRLFRGAKVLNVYGPTEACIYAAYYDCSSIDEASATTPIGIPLSNAKLYIVDAKSRLQPADVPGELCIGGAGLADGYLNLPELTAERFTSNPYATEEEIDRGDNCRIYRTGDICRWRADGNVEYLGRRDDQVKVRGYRLELKEIEAHLSRYPGIGDCAVVVKEHRGNRSLVAYYSSSAARSLANASSGSGQIKAYLESRLPRYAVPEIYVRLAQLPLAPSGKIDRQSLARQELAQPNALGSSEPSELGDTLLAIFKEVLGNDGLRATDNFQNAGGDSISAVLIAQKINDRFGLSLGGSILFRYPNIRLLSEFIEQRVAKPEAPGRGQEKAPPAVDARPQPRSKSRKYPEYYESCVAIIGMSCNFPQSQGHESLWENIRQGRECSRFRTASELRQAKVPEELIRNPQFVPVELTIDEKYGFDCDFFRLSERNAALMGPQFRLLLSHSWLALEDGGYVPADIRSTAVFMSASQHVAGPAFALGGAPEDSDEYLGWIMAQGGSIPSMISYQLDLRGPSLFVHSNCSSSLAALALAYQNLRLNECEYALVGAANALPYSKLGYVHQPGLNFSSTGHCRTFDCKADGMVGGEGVAVILLKRAVEAIDDRDHIYALLRGISVNNDGFDRAGFYAPGVAGQSAVIERALTTTGVDPESIGYVEAHGTGTRLGDPIELESLTAVYAKRTSRRRFCAVGSVKPNIGHLDTAAGLAGVIKVALSLHHREIPPSINYTAPNPEIDFENSPFYVPDAPLAWPKDRMPCRAALSSFGIGGTNVHAIFEEYRESDSDRAEG